MAKKQSSRHQRKLEDAIKKGQIARSAEVQTVFVLFGALAALTFAGREIWQQLVSATVLTLGHLHDTTHHGQFIAGLRRFRRLCFAEMRRAGRAGNRARGIARRRDSKPLQHRVRSAHAELEPRQSSGRFQAHFFRADVRAHDRRHGEIYFHPRGDVFGNPQRFERPDFHLVRQRRSAGGISWRNVPADFSARLPRRCWSSRRRITAINSGARSAT